MSNIGAGGGAPAAGVAPGAATSGGGAAAAVEAEKEEEKKEEEKEESDDDMVCYFLGSINNHKFNNLCFKGFRSIRLISTRIHPFPCFSSAYPFCIRITSKLQVVTLRCICTLISPILRCLKTQIHKMHNPRAMPVRTYASKFPALCGTKLKCRV